MSGSAREFGAQAIRFIDRGAVIALAAVLVFVFGFTLARDIAHAQLRGHGGPVRALAVSPDASEAISGSFDTSIIRWSLATNAAEQVLRFHDGAVNAVIRLNDGRIASSGEDGRIAIWKKGEAEPASVFERHTAPVVALAQSPDASLLASAAWDRTARIWPLIGSGEPRVFDGHTQNVNAVAFTPDGSALVTAGYDTTVRIAPLAGGGAAVVTTLPTPLNALAIAPDGEIATAGGDGKVYLLSRADKRETEIAALDAPVIALALSREGTHIAAAGIRGSVAIIDRASRKVLRTLVGPGLPVWSLAFLPDNRTLLTGGTDRMIRRWDVLRGEPIDAAVAGSPEDPLAPYADDPGAQVFRACVACHTLRADEGIRAGPTLAGILGRRIATLPGYNFSPALKKLDIVWTPATLSKLFEIGPAAYTPGTKMPEQRIGSAEERERLVKFLERATKNN